VEGIPKEFEALDESFRCSICRYHCYHEAVTMRPCGDSFCLECIQKTLRTDLHSNRRQVSCPKCGGNISSKVDNCLIPNRGLQESALAWWRGYLKSVENENHNNRNLSPTSTDPGGLPRRNNGTAKNTVEDAIAAPRHSPAGVHQRAVPAPSSRSG
jgi:hypothetical protein